MSESERKPDLTFFYSPLPKYGFKIEKLNEGPNYSYVNTTKIYADFQLTQVIGKLSRTGFVNTLGGNAINSYSALVELPEGTFVYDVAYNNSILTDTSPRSPVVAGNGSLGSVNINGATDAFEFSEGIMFFVGSPINDTRICYVYFNK